MLAQEAPSLLEPHMSCRVRSLQLACVRVTCGKCRYSAHARTPRNCMYVRVLWLKLGRSVSSHSASSPNHCWGKKFRSQNPPSPLKSGARTWVAGALGACAWELPHPGRAAGGNLGGKEVGIERVEPQRAGPPRGPVSSVVPSTPFAPPCVLKKCKKNPAVFRDF